MFTRVVDPGGKEHSFIGGFPTRGGVDIECEECGVTVYHNTKFDLVHGSQQDFIHAIQDAVDQHIFPRISWRASDG